jgi:hypothetical protein
MNDTKTRPLRKEEVRLSSLRKSGDSGTTGQQPHLPPPEDRGDGSMRQLQPPVRDLGTPELPLHVSKGLHTITIWGPEETVSKLYEAIERLVRKGRKEWQNQGIS